MIKSSALKTAFSIENLKKAWHWLQTSSDGKYKKYFRHIYSAYETALDDNLADLHKRLLLEEYKPQQPSKVFSPKKSGILRPYTLLTVEDQIVYQALANVIADHFSKKVRQRYNKKVFGHLYQGKKGKQFYQHWKNSYAKFGKTLSTLQKSGYKYIGDFDLVAFYDSIEHPLLQAELKKYQLDDSFCDFLMHCLKIWTASQYQYIDQPIQHNHGIPQGPLSSGLLAEVILTKIDEALDKQKKIKYLRYVDDIRILGKTEEPVRQELSQLDIMSKALGLYPQFKKSAVHQFTTINDEIKSVSGVMPSVSIAPRQYQKNIHQKLLALIHNNKITDETKFKYLLSHADPSDSLDNRLIRLLPYYKHLHESAHHYFSQHNQFSKKLAAALLSLLKKESNYFTYSATLIDLLRDRCPSPQLSPLFKICKLILNSRANNVDPSLRAAAASVLVKYNKLSTKELQKNILWEPDWWVRTIVQTYLDPEIHGETRCASLLEQLLYDTVCDPATTAADKYINDGLKFSLKKTKAVNRNAKMIFKNASAF